MRIVSTGKLTKADLKDVSGAGTRAGQIAWLQREGIHYKTNGKDELVVLWIHVQQWVEGHRHVAGRGIDWTAC